MWQKNGFIPVTTAISSAQIPHPAQTVLQQLPLNIPTFENSKIDSPQNKRTFEMLEDFDVEKENNVFFEETNDTSEIIDPEILLASSSSSVLDVSGPAQKKLKRDLPYTETYNGKTYHLSEMGLKNFNKLLANKQLEEGVIPKNCIECKEHMDWKRNGPIRIVNGVFYYQPRHYGACIKRLNDNHNKIALVFDQEFKAIDSELRLLNAKTVKTKEEEKQIVDLTERRDFCFQNGRHSKAKKAADEARANGMCPGYKDLGCPNKSKAPVVNGRQRIYCAPCQDKVSANNDNVLESHRKSAERAEGIMVTTPHAASLKTLGAVEIRKQIPANSISMLKGEFIGIDTSSTGQGSCDWEDLKELGGFFVDTSGNQHSFLAKRTFAPTKRSVESKWAVSIDGAASESLLFIPMLKSFAKWVNGRVIAYHTAAAECDYKRLTSVFTEKTAGIVSCGNPFPPFETGWLNTGQDVYRHLVGPKNVPVKSTYWKLTIVHEDLYSLKSNPFVCTPLDVGIVTVPPSLTNVLSDARKTWNLAQLLKTILSQ